MTARNDTRESGAYLHRPSDRLDSLLLFADFDLGSAMKRLLKWLLSLVALAIRYGVIGIRQTRDGRLRRRAWAVAGIIVAACFGLLVALSLTATALMYLL